MVTSENPPLAGAGYNRRSLFLLSVMALVTTGIGFSIRGNIASELQTDLFDPVDKLHSAEMVATALGTLGDRRAIQPLRALLDDAHPQVIQQAREALAQLEGSVEEAL